MKKIFSFILLSLLVQTAWSQSGEGYDPENPGDPDVYYTLTLEAAPLSGGTVSPNNRQKLSVGQSTYVSASPRLGYEFKRWMMGDSVVSTNSNFSFTMPEKDVVLTADFDWVGNSGYDPQNPDDPDAEGYSHKVYVYATPSAGGYFNSSSFTLVEGKTTNIYAYPREGYRFVSWKHNGKIVSTSNPMEITMGSENLEYTAQFVYDPVSPGNPGANSFNAATGELVIDDFEAGRLSSAIYTTLGTDDNYNKVKSITIIGTMQAGDFGFLKGMTNCTVADISRTTGYSNVPDYAFEGSSALKTLILPYSVESIGSWAFCGCSSLTTLYCYATTTPSVSNTTFDGVSSSMIVLVPALSLELYQSANYWKDFVLSALDGVTNTLTISLPEDAKDGRYKNMTLELDNITSGQVSRMLITDRTRYSFVNLIHNTKYNVYVKTAKSVVLGEIQDVEIVDKDVETAFAQLKQPQTVTMSVINDKGENLTESTDITWFDANGNYLATGNTISGYVDGTVLKYRVKLSNDAALYYVAPQDSTYEIKAVSNEFNCVLTPLQLMTVTGYVKNANTNKGIYDASVSISQQTSGKQSRTIVAKTDVNGKFTAEVFNSPASISCAAFDYVNKSIEVESFAVADGKVTMDDVMMNSIVGATVNVSLTYQESVLEGETPDVQDWYNDYQNLSLSVFNLTSNQEVTQISNRYPQFVLMDGVRVGDELRLTLSSKKGAFTPVIIDKKVDETEEINALFAIKQYGGMHASYQTTTNDAVVGILYDTNGYLQQKSDFANDNTLSFNGLKDGDYTLVTMGKNDSYNSIYNIARLRDAGLTENTDYSKNNITVESGLIRNINITNVPFLNIAKFQTINNEKSSLSVNKSSVVAGYYLTFTGVIELQDENITITDNMSLVVDIPSSASFVKGSVMVGDKVVDNYTFVDNTLTVPFNNVGQQNKIKFCVIPTIEGTFQPNAMVGFKANGEDVMIPIGSTKYDVDQMSISVPTTITRKEFTLSGVAPSNSMVTIYDGTTAISRVQTSANGVWKTECEIVNPINLTFHQIRAEVTNQDISVSSPTYSTYFNSSENVVKSITMTHFNNYYKEDKTVVFDLIKKTVTPSSYMFYQTADFSFIVDFENNDSSVVSDVFVNAKLSNGGRKKMEAKYDSKINRWVATGRFSSNSLPINVSVNFTNINETLKPYDEELVEASLNLVKDLHTQVVHSLDSIGCTFTDITESTFQYKYNIEDTPTFTVKIIDKKESIGYFNEFVYTKVGSEGTTYCIADTIVNNEFLIYLWNLSDDEVLLISACDENSTNVVTRAVISNPILNFIANFFTCGAFDIIDAYNARMDTYSQWLTVHNQTQHRHNEYNKKAKNLLNAKCEDGTLRLSQSSYEWYDMYRGFYVDDCLRFNKFLGEHIERYRQLIVDDMHQTQVFNATLGAIGVLFSALKFAPVIEAAGKVVSPKIVTDFITKYASFLGKTLPNWTGDITEFVAENLIQSSISGALNLNYSDSYERKYLSDWYNEETNKINTHFGDLFNNIKKSYRKCKEYCPYCGYILDDCICEDDEKTDDTTPVLDPSGYVYEGIFNNRIEGVTTTCYQKIQVEDMYGDLHDNIIKWDAEEYGQENPLHTDKDGFYQWFVPEGLWQVKYEKEGYETAYSEWLPVPPPQLDVNIGIVQNRQPEVKEAHAYEDGLELTFDKYMMPAYLTTENIKVSQNGKYVDGKVALVDEEVAYRDENVKYASTVRFVPNTPFSAGKDVTLVVANKVKSYAGIQMADNFTQTFDIEKEVKSIVADSLVKVPYQGSKVITLYVQPADAAVGKTMHADNSSEMIASLVQKNVTIDENGMVQFEINGELPGTTGITFSIDGVKATATVIANVGNFETSLINEPKASLVSGSSVYLGTTVKLTADNNDLKIWYTTDGTCPCDENGTRQVYSAPIVITGDMVIKAMAETAEGDGSDVATFTYSILRNNDGIALNDGWNWISFNMKNDALGSINTAMASGSWTSDDVVKDNKYVDMYSANQKQWIGTMPKNGALNSTQMYKIRSSKAQTLSLTGEAVHPSETTIAVGPGWNYISYLPLVNMSVNDALKSYRAENGDIIKSQDAFATYSTTNGWEGDLTTLTIGRGYMLKRGVNASQVSFTYPVGTSGSSVKAPASAKSYRYADNMNIIGEVEGISVENGDSIVAYVNGEIRGASRLERNQKVFLTVQGDEDAKMAIVLVRDGEIIATASNMIGYQSNNVLGTSDAPTAITFVTDDRSLDGTIGNVKAIYNINGIKMKTRRLNSIPAGTYIIYSEKKGNTCVTKFIK